METPFPNGSVLALLRNTLMTDGEMCESTAMSDAMIEGELGLVAVNSPDLMKPKNPVQQAAHSRHAT